MEHKKRSLWRGKPGGDSGSWEVAEVSLKKGGRKNDGRWSHGFYKGMVSDLDTAGLDPMKSNL